MFVIVGWGRRTIQVLGFTAARICTNCGNTTQWKVLRTRRWFTLFFIPVVPYSSSYHAICPVCSRGFQVDPRSVQKFMSAQGVPAEVPPAAPAPQAPGPAEQSQLLPWARASSEAEAGTTVQS